MELLSPTDIAKDKILAVQEYSILAGRSLSNLFRQPRYMSDWMMQADLIGVDPVLSLETSRLLALSDETDQTMDFAGDWADEGVWAIIEGLNREQAARLLAELPAENG